MEQTDADALIVVDVVLASRRKLVADELLSVVLACRYGIWKISPLNETFLSAWLCSLMSRQTSTYGSNTQVVLGQVYCGNRSQATLVPA